MSLLAEPRIGFTPPEIRRVYLTGFMGAGKSTVGPLLASKLQWTFLDLDALIEAAERRSISAIFEEEGEGSFRQLEASALRRVQTHLNVVISLGGGAVETPEIRDLLSADADGALIFLEAPLAYLIERCTGQDGGSTRPLLRDIPALEKRYQNRLTHYRKAHLTVATQDLRPEEVAAEIVRQLAARKQWK